MNASGTAPFFQMPILNANEVGRSHRSVRKARKPERAMAVGKESKAGLDTGFLRKSDGDIIKAKRGEPHGDISGDLVGARSSPASQGDSLLHLDGVFHSLSLTYRLRSAAAGTTGTSPFQQCLPSRSRADFCLENKHWNTSGGIPRTGSPIIWLGAGRRRARRNSARVSNTTS